MAVTLVMLVLFYAGGKVEGTEGTNLPEPLITEAFLIWAYILLVATICLTIGFSVLNMFLNGEGAKKSLVGIVGVGVVLVISYFLANDTPLDLPHYTGPDNVPATLKWVDTGLITAYILAGVAVIAILISEVSKAFK